MSWSCVFYTILQHSCFIDCAHLNISQILNVNEWDNIPHPRPFPRCVVTNSKHFWACSMSQQYDTIEKSQLQCMPSLHIAEKLLMLWKFQVSFRMLCASWNLPIFRKVSEPFDERETKAFTSAVEPRMNTWIKIATCPPKLSSPCTLQTARDQTEVYPLFTSQLSHHREKLKFTTSIKYAIRALAFNVKVVLSEPNCPNDTMSLFTERCHPARTSCILCTYEKALYATVDDLYVFCA